MVTQDNFKVLALAVGLDSAMSLLSTTWARRYQDLLPILNLVQFSAYSRNEGAENVQCIVSLVESASICPVVGNASHMFCAEVVQTSQGSPRPARHENNASEEVVAVLP